MKPQMNADARGKVQELNRQDAKAAKKATMNPQTNADTPEILRREIHRPHDMAMTQVDLGDTAFVMTCVPQG